VRLTRRCLAAAAAAHQLLTALGMEWVVYIFGFTAVSLVMDSQSIQCGSKCVHLVHSTSRQPQGISLRVDGSGWKTKIETET